MEFVENATDFKLPIFYVCPMDFDFVKIYENFCKKKYGTEFSLCFSLVQELYNTWFFFLYLMTMTLAYYGNDMCWLKTSIK